MHEDILKPVASFAPFQFAQQQDIKDALRNVVDIPPAKSSGRVRFFPEGYSCLLGLDLAQAPLEKSPFTLVSDQGQREFITPGRFRSRAEPAQQIRARGM